MRGNQFWAQSLGGSIAIDGEESVYSLNTTTENATGKPFSTLVQ